MRNSILLGLLLALSGCGAIYKSPAISTQTVSQTPVRVVAISGENLLLANSSPYRPKTLPAVFNQTAGTGSDPASMPMNPQGAMMAQPRPGAIETRLPPKVKHSPYRIGIGDVVVVATQGGYLSEAGASDLGAAPNTRRGYTVQDDGAVAIPNVGRVRIAHMTVDQAEATLFQTFVANQIDPTFSLEVAEFNAHRVSIGGAVSNPAIAAIKLTPLYLDEVIAAAGGITVSDQDYASVRLYRQGSLYQIPLQRLYSDPALMKTPLLANDSIFVDTEYDLAKAQTYFEQQILLEDARRQSRELAVQELLTEVSLRRANLEEARSNFQVRSDFGANDQDHVYLTGEVKTQMRYTLPYEQRASLADALYGAGDGVLVRTGDISEIYVLRASPDPREFGAVTAWHLDARNAANLTLATRFELRPDDIIFVAEQPVTRWNRVIQQITPSLLTTSMVAAIN